MRNWGVGGRVRGYQEQGARRGAVGLGSLERAVWANFRVFEKSLLKLFGLLENINIVEN